MLAKLGLLGMLPLLVAACQPSEGRPLDRDSGIITGSWGGRHVGLMLGPLGGTLDYDCASGTIDSPVRPDRGGHFAAVGRHTPGQGGPEREGQQAQSWPATYSGRLRGDEMTLSVRVEQTGIEIGPLRLGRNAEPIIFRCL